MTAREAEAPWWARVAFEIARVPLSMRVVLALAALLHGLGLSWGMPASDAWDNDGIAPRDILPGLAATFTPGQYYTYPPVHLALLAVLTLPVTVVAVARAGSTRVSGVIHEILAPPYMTAYAMTARVVSLLMSLGIAVALAKMAEEICAASGRQRAERVGTFVAAIASAGVALTYYAHTSNLDVPSLFWGSFAALALVRAIARHEPRRLRRAAALAALAVATKDQAYALFVVSAPVLIASSILLDPWSRANWRALAREGLVALGLAAVLLAVLDGALFNPTGFRARLAFLRGPASQDFSMYSSDVVGKAAIVLDIVRQVDRHYPSVFGALILVGVLDAAFLARRRPSALVTGLSPLVFAISFTLAFNFAARRVEDRFTLPQFLFAAVYAGMAMDRVWGMSSGAMRARAGAAHGRLAGLLPRAACLGLLGLGLWQAVRVDLTLLFEPRYAAEAFLRAKVGVGDAIEVHGLNAYLPRFPDQARVVRVGPSPPSRRGPLPGIEEVQAPFMDLEQRRPRFIVVSTCFAWRFLATDTRSVGGRVYPPGQQREAVDPDATTFFRGLFSGKLGYRVAHAAVIEPGIWAPVAIHASTNCPITTFERVASP